LPSASPAVRCPRAAATQRKGAAPKTVSRHRPPRCDQIFTVLSSDAERTRMPLGEYAQALTPPECPSKRCSSRPVARSHSRSVLSADAERTRVPSGEYAHASTGPNRALC
jgi:hypothetical protein